RQPENGGGMEPRTHLPHLSGVGSVCVLPKAMVGHVERSRKGLALMSKVLQVPPAGGIRTREGQQPVGWAPPAGGSALAVDRATGGMPPLAGDLARCPRHHLSELRSERGAARLIDGDRRRPRRGQYGGHVALRSAGSLSDESSGATASRWNPLARG